MKRLLVLFLALLLLCGCAPASGPTQTAAPTTETAAPPQPEPTAATPSETAVLEDARLSDLTADTVLLYRQAEFKSRQGTLFSMDSVRSASEEALLPRSHEYDDCFPGDSALWLQLLDYAFANEYQGFSVRTRSLPALSEDQRSAIDILYRIDDGRMCFLDTDGVTTAFYLCNRTDAMEKFAVGLQEARRIASEAPRGDDWETAEWIFRYLADHLTYGDRETYYSDRGHHLYDALVENECLCSGYADAMYYLCNLCGVECLELQGWSNGPAGPGSEETDGHAWNIVRVYGTWYVCDPTFNDTAPMPADVPLCFCLSSRFMEATFGHRADWIYADANRIPACETCFDPVSAWNATPEGALKSWLWFAAYDAFDPTYLLACGGIADFRTEDAVSDESVQIDTDISYAAYAAWAGRFMQEDAALLLPWVFAEGGNGRLILRRADTDSGIDWAKLKILSVTEENGVYTADLGAASAVYTVSKTADGLYRIETIAVTANQ